MAKTQQERNDASKAKDAERGAEDLRLKTYPGTAAALATLMQRHGIEQLGPCRKNGHAPKEREEQKSAQVFHFRS